MSADFNYYMYFGPQPTFGEDQWNRFTSKDRVDWKQQNEKWDSRTKVYYMPIDFVNFPDQELGRTSVKYDLWFRYSSMLYMALLVIGSNELGPVNNFEMIYFVGTLIVSAMLNSIVFAEVAGLFIKIQ